MRKIFLSFLGVMFCFLSSISQNTLLRENYFTIGNLYSLYRISSLSNNTVLISGDNVEWDFSDIEYTVLDTLTALEPSETEFYFDPNVNYNTSELCLNSTNKLFQVEDNMFSYFHSSVDQVSFAGEWAGNPTWGYYFYQFEDPEQYFAFPFNYGDSFTDEFLSTGLDMSGSGWHKSWGIRTVVADGFGTLIMPDKTYSNCLRVKAIINYSDSSGTWGVENYTKYQYTWFDLETNGHVLDIELGSNLWLLNADYYFNNPLVASKNLLFESNIILSPNPVRENLYVQFPQPVSGKIDFVIYNMTGKTLMNFNDRKSTVFELNVKELKDGIYLLGIITSEGSSVKKFVKL